MILVKKDYREEPLQAQMEVVMTFRVPGALDPSDQISLSRPDPYKFSNESLLLP